MLVKLDIGCGTRKREGFVWVDVLPLPGVDGVCDLEQPRPFPDDSADEIYCSHVLEHIRNLPQLMKEFWRIAKNGARIEIIVPYFRSERAFRDPTHVRYFTYLTFDYFSNTDSLPHYDLETRFTILKKELIFSCFSLGSLNWKGKIRHTPYFLWVRFWSKVFNRWPMFYEGSFFSSLWPAQDLQVILKVCK